MRAEVLASPEQPKRSAGVAAFALAVALLVVTQYLGHRAGNEQKDAALGVAHTHEVIEQLDGLLVAILDAESARRGYSITGDEAQLHPYRNAGARAFRCIEELRILTADNPRQLTRIDALEPKVRARMANLDAAIADRQKGRDEPSELKRTIEGSAITVSIRELLGEMTAEERSLLAQRQQRSAETSDHLRLLQMLGTGVAVGLFFLAVAGVRREIRRREEMEGTLREHDAELTRVNSFLDSLIENLPAMIFVKEAKDLSFVLFNRAGEDLIGIKRDEMIGKTDLDFFPEEEAKAFIAKDRETLEGKEIVDILEEPLTTEAGTRWLHTKKVPVLDANGEPAYLLGISLDITARREAEEALRETRDRAELANRELETFSYSVAHDLRTPLRSIDGFCQALLEDNAKQLDEQGKAHLERVRAAARRMGELIDDLLALARTTRAELNRSDVDLTALAKEVGGAASDKYPGAKLEVADGMKANADPRLLKVVLENLLSNAFKFSQKKEGGAAVEVGVREPEPDVAAAPTYFVRDNGAGFDAKAATKLFGAFQRYHRPTEYEGTGIGLATAERIVSRHGGRIWAESAPGEGATFYFTLDRGADT